MQNNRVVRSGMTNDPEQPPLIYVFLRNKLPAYAWHSLYLARRNYSGEIILLTDILGARAPKGVTVIQSDKWYDGSPFERFRNTTVLDKSFRNGFWLLAAERFFVLHAYAREFCIPRFFHAELDVLIVNLRGVGSRLDSIGDGFFCPTEGPGRAIASLVYFNSFAVLSDLIRFFFDNAHLGNEMNILGSFMEQSAGTYVLPSLPVDRDQVAPDMKTSASHLGFFDAAFLGQWLFGMDPKNSPRSVMNHYRNPFVPATRENPALRASLFGRVLKIMVPERGWLDVHTVHVHSKVFRRLRFPGVLAFYSLISRLPIETVIKVRWSGWISWLLALMLRRKVVDYFEFLPVPLRSIASRTLVFLVAKSPRLISNRELSVLGRIIGSPKLLPSVPVETRFLRRSQPEFKSSRGKELGLNVDPFRQDLQWCSNLIDWSFREKGAVVNFVTDPVGANAQQSRISTQVLPIFLGLEKEHRRSTMTRNFWGLPDTAFSVGISSRSQIVKADWVVEMFGGDLRKAQEWLSTVEETMIHSPEEGCSLLNAYGMWSLFYKSHETVISQGPNGR